MDYHYDCIPKQIDVNGKKMNCSQLCCYTGCYVSQKEIEFTDKILPDLKPMLQPDAREVLKQKSDQVYIPEDYDDVEKLYKTRCAPEEWPEPEKKKEGGTGNEEQKDEEEDDDEDSLELPPKNHCIFLMDNGLCSVHKYCVENGKDWVKEKYNICVTFPLDLRPQDQTLAFMNDFDSFTFGDVDCISNDEEHKKNLGMPQVIDSMKYAIVDRYGEKFWAALNAFARDYRAGKIDLKYVYKDLKKNK
jgi:hypothetical protein